MTPVRASQGVRRTAGCGPRAFGVAALVALLLTGCAGPPDEREQLGAIVGEILAAPLPPAGPEPAEPARWGPPVAPTPLVETAPPRPQPVVERGTGVFIGPEPTRRLDARVTERGEVTLNFVNADIREVVRVVLGDILGRNHTVSPAVAGTVTIQTEQPIPRAAVLDVFERALQLTGATVIAHDDLLEVVPSDLAVRSGATVRVAPRRRAPMPGFGVEIVPLEFIGAGEMRTLLAPVIAPETVVEVDAARNLLIVAGSSAQRTSVVELVEAFDVDWLRGQSVGLFPLEFAGAEAIAAELRSILGAGEGGPLAGVVRLDPIERLNAVLVISTRPQYLDRAADWIRRLDQGIAETSPQVFVYYVQNTRAADLAEVLAQIFAPQQARALERFGEVAPGRTPVAITGGLRAGSVESRSGAAPTAGRRGPRLAGLGQQVGGNPPQAAPILPSRRSRVAAETTPLPAEAEAPPDPAVVPPVEAPAAPVGAPPAAEEVLLPGEDEIRIIADERNNALVVLATPRDYRRVEAALRKLDIVPLQVLIEATIAEVTLTDSLEYGLRWFFETGDFAIRFSDLAGGLVDPTFPGFSAVFDTNDARAVLSAIASITDLNVISAPQVLVLDNQTAVLQVGDQVPVPVQQVVPVEAIDRVVNTIEFRDTGTILLVTPRVNASGLVMLEIEQEVSDAVQTVTSGIDAPTIQRRLIQTTVAVGSGETLALGGLIRDRTQRTRAGVPVLMEIPLFGALFRRTTDAATRSEILVLITPRVVRNEVDARMVTDELRRRLRSLAPLEARIRVPPAADPDRPAPDP